MHSSKLLHRIHRHTRIRKKISGTANRPRLVVYRSLISNYAQIIDDESGKTLCATSDLKSRQKGTKVQNAQLIGQEIAKKALALGINSCVFDRNGYKYHGRVKAIAEGARAGGLQF